MNIVDLLITADSPTGCITNSDIEQAALVYHPHVLLHYHDVSERTLAVLSDNIAAISRERGSTSVNSPSAYLCRLSSLHQRQYRYPLQPSYLPGPLNTMEVDLSLRWDLFDSQILQFFEHYLSAGISLDDLLAKLRNELICDSGLVNAALSAAVSPGCRSMATSYSQPWQRL